MQLPGSAIRSPAWQAEIPRVRAIKEEPPNLLEYLARGQPKALHDRILHASCQGQVVITDDSEFMRKNFDSGNLVFYSIKENDIRSRVEEILSDDQLRFKMARAGQDYMRKGLHGSDQAAKRVLQQLKEYELI